MFQKIKIPKYFQVFSLESYLKSAKSSSPVRKPLGANGFLPINPSSLSCQNLISVSPSFQQSQTSWSNLIQGKSSKPSSTLLIIIPISSSSSMDLYRFDTAPFNCCFFLMKLSSEDPDSTVFCSSSCNETPLVFCESIVLNLRFTSGRALFASLWV